jgi:predicted transposase YbfD/YdcC
MRGTVLENGRNPDIVSAYSLGGGVTLATDMCEEKSNEITSVPKLLDKVDVSGRIVTADAMSFQKAIIDKIRKKGGDFLIELKANQRTLRYGIEDNVELAEPVDVYSEGPFLEHGRIETRVCRIFRGNDLITDREKWDGDLTVIEIRTATERKSDGQKSSERRFYVSSWDLDRNLRQDFIRRKSARSARNLDTIQRMVLAILSIWKGKRKKLSDKAKGTAELIRELSMNFTAMMQMLAQK